MFRGTQGYRYVIRRVNGAAEPQKYEKKTPHFQLFFWVMQRLQPNSLVLTTWFPAFRGFTYWLLVGNVMKEWKTK